MNVHDDKCLLFPTQTPLGDSCTGGGGTTSSIVDVSLLGDAMKPKFAQSVMDPPFTRQFPTSNLVLLRRTVMQMIMPVLVCACVCERLHAYLLCCSQCCHCFSLQMLLLVM